MSKYNVGDKFIIRIIKDDTMEIDTNSYYITNDGRLLEESELDKLQKYEEEKISYSEAYNKGLNDAWELARKIDLFDGKERIKIFGYLTSEYIKEHYTVQEALAKLEAYEKEQNEIKVGDVIICYDKEGVVTKVDDNYFNIIYEDGSSDKISQIICKEKTGKHIDIQSLLEQIKE